MVRADLAAVPIIPASAEFAHAKTGPSPASTNVTLSNITSLFIFTLVPSTDNYLKADEELCNDD